MIESKSKYYRTLLKSREDKAVYDQILDGMRQLQKTIILENSLFPAYRTPISEIITYVLDDNPGLFFVDSGNIQIGISTVYRYVNVGYRYEYEEIVKTESKITAEIERIIQIAKQNKLSAHETELFIHDYLAVYVSYNHKYNKNQNSKSFNKVHSVIGPLTHGRTAVCEGYSKAFKLLCDAAGISCIIVNGGADDYEKPDGNNHSWNIVKIGRQCFHVDVTWDSCLRNHDKASHKYYNLTDDEIATDHWWNTEMLPACS